MALTSRIELRSGADLRLRWVLWLAWLMALGNLIAHADRMPIWLMPLCAALLYWSLPRHFQTHWQRRRLALYADGKAQWDNDCGVWQPATWRSCWYTAICFKSGDVKRWLWISASNNDPEAYRLLGIWCRFTPQQALDEVNDSH